MKLWPVALFFIYFWNWGTYKTLQYAISCTAVKKWHAAMFCMFPDSKSEWKKWATSQSFIRKEITSYRIGTLVSLFLFLGNQCCGFCVHFFTLILKYQGLSFPGLCCFWSKICFGKYLWKISMYLFSIDDERIRFWN